MLVRIYVISYHIYGVRRRRRRNNDRGSECICTLRVTPDKPRAGLARRRHAAPAWNIVHVVRRPAICSKRHTIYLLRGRAVRIRNTWSRPCTRRLARTSSGRRDSRRPAIPSKPGTVDRRRGQKSVEDVYRGRVVARSEKPTVMMTAWRGRWTWTVFFFYDRPFVWRTTNDVYAVYVSLKFSICDSRAIDDDREHVSSFSVKRFRAELNDGFSSSVDCLTVWRIQNAMENNYRCDFQVLSNYSFFFH